MTSRLGAAVAVALFAIALSMPTIVGVPFHTKGEPREAVQVVEIVEHGRWVLQIRNGDELPSKPPLFHWIGALVSFAHGRVDEMSTRLPSVLTSVLAVVATFAFGAARWGTRAGVFAAVVLAATFEWMRSSTHARVDMVLTAFLTTAFLSLEVALRSSTIRIAPLVVLYLSMALAVLAKGPVGLILPGLVAIAYTAVLREPGRLFTRLKPFHGSIVAIAIPAVWYVLAALEGGPEFVDKQLLRENFGRFLEADETGVGHVHPWYYVIGGFFLGFAPWSLFIPALAISLWRDRRNLEATHRLFPLVWFTVVMAFFSLAEGKRTVYVLSAYPAAALLLGRWGDRVVSGRAATTRVVRISLQIGAVGLLVVLGGAVVVLTAEALGVSTLDAIRPLLHHRDAHNVEIVRELARSHAAIVVVWGLALFAALAVLVRATLDARWVRAATALVGAITLLTWFAGGGIRAAVAHELTLRPFARELRARVAEGDRLFFHPETFDYGVVFYGRRNVTRAPLDSIPASTDAQSSWLLAWEKEWSAEPASVRDRFEARLRSQGTGSSGVSAMLLLRARPRPDGSVGDRDLGDGAFAESEHGEGERERDDAEEVQR